MELYLLTEIPYLHVCTVVLDTPLEYSLDDCMEYIQEDELVEVTPSSIRMCKNPKFSKMGT
ncbi:putative elongation factor TypA-like svr3, chloroplastic [Sarracenia purpurea var. burkii]